MIELSKIALHESIQLGPKATTSVDVNDPYEPRRRDWAGIKMHLEESSGLITITFRGDQLFLHISACKYAKGLGGGALGGGHTVTRYDPNAADDDDEVQSQAAFAAQVTLSEEDPDEFDDPPPKPAPKKRGRPPKVKQVEQEDEE